MLRVDLKSSSRSERSLAPPRAERVVAPNLASYDHILIAGKDSLACLLHLNDAGADPRRIELHHHDVDGRGPPTFDGPITAGYCRAIAEAFRVGVYVSWRDGGLRREMLRDGDPTAGVMFETPEREIAPRRQNRRHAQHDL